MLAGSVRALVLVGPLLLSLIVTATATRMFGAPRGLGPRLLWLTGLLALSTAVVWAADRVLRRLLPLAALLEMSVLFPGPAPTRFSVARQTGTTRQLEDLVTKAHESDASTEPVVAAARILALVGALRSHDKATRGHSERVRVLTDLVGEELGLPVAERDRLRWAALLHDIGKLDVPPEILNKPGKPTPDEWERLKRHPAAGQELAAPLLSWLGASAPVIIQHHERWDGLGYPAGLRGTEICIGARAVAVADAFEVMTAARSYKKAMPRAVALREMAKLAGTQFDPAAVRALLSISAPRLRWAIGPWAWLAQLPVIGTAPSLAGVTAVAGQAAAGASAVGLGTAVGLTSLTPQHLPGEVAPQVLPAIVLQRQGPVQPQPSLPSASPTSTSTAPSPRPVAVVPAPRSPAPVTRTATRVGPVAAPVSPSPSPSPTAKRKTPSPPATAASAASAVSPSPSPSPTPTPHGKPSRTPKAH